jgi:hypothetical protein
MSIHIRDGALHRIDLVTRMPFKYGIATMTQTPHVFVRLEVEVEGTRAVGIAADHLPPKWFTKDPHKALDDEIAEMVRVIEHAVRGAAGLRAASPFDAWRQLYEQQSVWGRQEGLAPLLAHFGTSLAERAMLDAFCRAKRQPIGELLRSERLGIRLGDIHAPLSGRSPSELLPKRSLTRIIARHTIGLADPIVESDIAEAERLNDGLPQSLEACIRTYGLRHFKIKVSGALGTDRARLERIAAVISACCPADFAFSLDGNEQFHAAEDLHSYWADLVKTSALTAFFGHLLFVEQPFHRDVALAPELGGTLDELPPMIIDESDSELDSLPRALALGYGGTSHKNCKGVFRGIANACLLEWRRRTEPVRASIMSGEDLANIGPVALLQDLAVCAALGIQSVERNGHHYFAGLSMFPRPIQQQVLQAHGDLYHASPGGWPTLTIVDGALRLDSVNAAPFGVEPAIDVGLLDGVGERETQTGYPS